MPDLRAELDQALASQGLHIRGVLIISAEQVAELNLAACAVEANAGASIALVGNIGSSLWPQFSSSAEFHDQLPDPLDRWSRRIAEELEQQLPVQALYPFEGPPYYPFQRWAQQAETLTQSPLGLMIHPQYGLWHAYRFALLCPAMPLRAAPANDSPCITCVEQPCLHSCPVQAFDGDGYDVDACAVYLKQSAGSDCRVQGCQARLACPVGVEYRYTSAQQVFHLSAFLSAR